MQTINTDQLDGLLAEVNNLVKQAEALKNKNSSGGSGSTGTNGSSSGSGSDSGSQSKKTTDTNGSNLPATNNVTTAGFGKLGLGVLAAAAVGFGAYAIKKRRETK